MSKITSKGQVTIPKEIREDFGFLPGTEIEFVRDGDDIRVRKLPGGRSRGDEIVERLRRASGGDVAMSTDEIMALTRGEN
ncbi:MAG TPA: AbrB/MazE/SpoVT family DNA-binding domain-containing protein [Solirubrobacterales bacterium]